jgi:hypothetical protein
VRPPGVLRHDGVHDAVDAVEVGEADVQGALVMEDADRVGGSEPCCFAGLGSSGSGFYDATCAPEVRAGRRVISIASIALDWAGDGKVRYISAHLI